MLGNRLNALVIFYGVRIMKRQLYFEPMFSNRREKLIELCVELQNQGKNFIYILPSREALGYVRYKFLEKLGGIINSKIIMFDEFEKDITGNDISNEKIVYQDIQRLLIKGICEKLKGELKYFKNICTKNGFIEESHSFIKNLKRNCISVDKLNDIIEKIQDEILKEKIFDLQLIYEKYNNCLSKKGLYDINDISLLALNKVKGYGVLNKIDTIIIDGFINIDKVNQDLIREISLLNKVDIYVNCPYVNHLTLSFIKDEILKPFKGIEFDVQYKADNLYETKSQFKELSEKLYSGEKMKAKPSDITIIKYPCIASEVRETARSLKEKLINGIRPEDIALFINSKDEYSSVLNSVFKEFQIPLYMNYEVPLSDAKLSRDILEKLRGIDLESANAEEWFKILQEEVDIISKDTYTILSKAFNFNLNFQEKLCLKAFEGMQRLINDMKDSFIICGIIEDNFDKQEFINNFTQYLEGTTVTIEAANNAGVKILNTDLAKGIFHKYIYVLGLNDGEMPRVIKNDGLFDELEVVKLRDVGIQYEDYLWELSREKIRFNLCLSSALESITLSYRSSDEDGKFAIPSPLLEEVKFVTGIETYKTITMRDRFNIPISNAMSRYELKAINLNSYFEKRYRDYNEMSLDEQIRLISKFENSITNFINRGEVEYHREREQHFNKYEGNLKGVIEDLVINKGSFSPSRLNTYLKCPFSYMMQNIFGLEEVREEEENLSLMEIGDFYHRVLNYYYSGLQNFTTFDEVRFEERVDKAWIEMRALEISEDDEQKLKGKLEATVKNFIQCDLKRINSFEKESGNIIRPYVLEEFIESDLFGIPITCKVHRVDIEYFINNGKYVPTGKFIVYDYKKNKISDIDKMLEKENCQIAFYYYFVSEYLKKKLKIENLDCIALLYLSVEGTNKSVKKNGLYRTEFKKALGFTGNSKFDMDKEMFYVFLGFLKDLILEAINNIKDGYFPYKLYCECFDKFNYSDCYYKEMCRFSKNKMSVLAEV
jgi:ATP-dependent helicase/nuclease subunit B